MEVSWLRLRQVVIPFSLFNLLINLPPFHYPPQVLCLIRDHRISLIPHTFPHIHLHHVLGGQELAHTAKDQKRLSGAWKSPLVVEEMQPIDLLRETEESHFMIGKGKGKGGTGSEEVDFDSFDGDDEGKQRLEGWNVTRA